MYSILNKMGKTLNDVPFHEKCRFKKHSYQHFSHAKCPVNDN